MNDKIMLENLKIINESIKQSKIRHCVHPNKNKCSEKIINAHSIQNNKILNKLSEKGLVITLKPYSEQPFFSGQLTGRGVASTFTGFCKYHDTVMFSPIENNCFNMSDEHCFLYAYRALALEYHKKLEVVKKLEYIASATKQSDSSILKEFILGKKDCEYYKKNFDDALIGSRYNILVNFCYELDYEVEFAVSTAVSPLYNMDGEKLYHRKSTEPWKTMYISIFPENGKTNCLFSWFLQDDAAFSKWKTSFCSLSQEGKLLYLNFFLVDNTENIIISPRLWNKWGKDGQENFLTLFHLSPMLEKTIKITIRQNDTLGFDLFQK